MQIADTVAIPIAEVIETPQLEGEPSFSLANTVLITAPTRLPPPAQPVNFQETRCWVYSPYQYKPRLGKEGK